MHMKKVYLILILIFPLKFFAQYTYIPDANFEQALINEGYDMYLDGYVETSSIDTITELYVNNKDINSLSGIEDFIALESLFCYENNLTSLNLSNNSNLFEVTCSNNNLESIDLRNGNNTGLWYFMSMNNPFLNCIDVDDIAWCEYNFAVDTWTSFSNECNPSSIHNIYTKKKLIKITDVNGRIVKVKPNTPLLYIYNDGTVKKKIIIE